MNTKSFHSFAYKTFVAVMIVMLALTAMPVSPAMRPVQGLAAPRLVLVQWVNGPTLPMRYPRTINVR